MPFKQLEQISLADRVEEQLLESIHEGRFAPGSPLPGEVELAEQMQVSRNVVREAVSRLRMLGLVKSRKRKGSVVSRPDVFLTLRRILHPAPCSTHETNPHPKYFL
jgi:DNA-binding FadR family transcriptional regulator